jgi:SAM-dependent methyltransferase
MIARNDDRSYVQDLSRTTTVNSSDDPVQALVEEMTNQGQPLRVLEAGAGSRSHIRLGANTELVGIDICQEQLDNNRELHQKILGDIQIYPLPPSSFDIIFCWDVLEHLKRPDLALQNFLRAIRPGGLIVMGAPAVNSIKGMITKYTPHWFHVFVYRHLLGNKNAGKPGHVPFPTFLRYSMSPRSLRSFARKHGLVIEYFDQYEEKVQVRIKKKHWSINLAYLLIGPLLRVASFGCLNPDITDFTIVLRKPGSKTLASSGVHCVLPVFDPRQS